MIQPATSDSGAKTTGDDDLDRHGGGQLPIAPSIKSPINSRNNSRNNSPGSERSASGWSASNRLALCISVHVAIDVLIARSFITNGSYLFFMLTGVLLSQISLVAIWATTGQQHLILRCAVTMLVALGCWTLLALHHDASAGQAAAFWGIELLVQIFVVVAAVNGHNRFLALRRKERAPFAIDLQTLMTFTAVCAVGFGCFQLASNQWNWRMDFSDPKIAIGLPLLGLVSGFVAATTLWAMIAESRKQLLMRFGVGTGILMTMIMLLSVFLWDRELTPNLSAFKAIVLAISIIQTSHVAIIITTLLAKRTRFRTRLVI